MEKRMNTCPSESPPCDEWVGIYLNHGIMLEERYSAHGRQQDLDKAVSDYRAAIKLMAPVHDACRLEANRRVEKLVKLYHQKTAEVAPDPNREKHLRQYKLGNALLTRFERTHTLKDLDSATSSLRALAEQATDANPDKHTFLSRLADAQYAHFKFSKDLGDLKGAISALQDANSTLQEAIRLMPEGHPDKMSRLQLFASLEKDLREERIALFKDTSSPCLFKQAMRAAPRLSR